MIAAVFVSIATLVIVAILSSANSPFDPPLKTGSALQRGKKRIAVMWVFTGDLPVYWKWTLATLLNGGSKRVDVHIICGTPTEQYYNQISNGGNITRRVIFHEVTPDDWRRRIFEKMGIDIKYNLAWCGRKVADFKPALGDLFQDFIPSKDYAWWVYGDSDGFFGSYNNIVDIDRLQLYDIVSGFPIAPKDNQILLAENNWRPIFCTGGWTMVRNSAYFNLLYQRAQNWQNAFTDSTYHAFDEESLDKSIETMNSFLRTADDVRRCCVNDRSPSVLKRYSNDPQPIDQILIAGMSARFLRKNSTVTIRWEARQGLKVNIVGYLGFSDSYRNETFNVLFFHFLQWKYCCMTEMLDALAKLTHAVESTEGSSIFTVKCFEMVATDEKTFSFALC